MKALFTLALSLVACGGTEAQPTETVEATGNLTIEATPNELVRGVNTFSVTVTPYSADLALDASVFMPSMGHGASVQPQVTALGQGAFRVDDVVFAMPGTWELKLHAHAAHAQETRTFSYDVR